MKFLYGAATAAHQVEGNNVHSDLWAVENMEHSTNKEPSLDAVDHYNRYKEDLALLKKAGGNAYRFTIEWARIEPEKGNYDINEIEHYREKLIYCHEIGLTPVVTLHHFSSPKWLIKEGGWKSKSTIEYFSNYAKKIAIEFGDLIPYICTINEINMGIQIQKLMISMSDLKSNSKEIEHGDIQVGLNIDDIKNSMADYFSSLGKTFEMVPQDVNLFLSPRNQEEEALVMNCHMEAVKVIKEINSNIKVGATFSIFDHQALPGGEPYVKQEQYDDFLYYLPYLESDDFIGVQNYSRKVYDTNGVVPLADTTRITSMGYEFYPKAISNVIRFVASHWNKEIVVTENGIATDNDDERIEFIHEAIKGIHECLKAGVNLRGYLHWTLTDNYEWQLGYDINFGLISVDRTSQTRYPKKSLNVFGSYLSTFDE